MPLVAEIVVASGFFGSCQALDGNYVYAKILGDAFLGLTGVRRHFLEVYLSSPDLVEESLFAFDVICMPLFSSWVPDFPAPFFSFHRQGQS
jgi:hypothetical protein